MPMNNGAKPAFLEDYQVIRPMEGKGSVGIAPLLGANTKVTN